MSAILNQLRGTALCLAIAFVFLEATPVAP